MAGRDDEAGPGPEGRHGAGELELVGLEAVRRDWSGVARRFQRELLARVFHDRPLVEFIRAFVADLRAGRHDDELVYRKAVRKPLARPAAKSGKSGQAPRAGSVADQQARVRGFALDLTNGGPDGEDAEFGRAA